jgi:hypothetical protein
VTRLKINTVDSRCIASDDQYSIALHAAVVSGAERVARRFGHRIANISQRIAPTNFDNRRSQCSLTRFADT